MNKLEEITQHKKKEVEERCKHIENDDIYFDPSKDTRVPKEFAASLRNDKLSLIAEVKKASPSKGIIREDFNHLDIAKSYEKHGANCLSVLTDEKYFQGQDQYLVDIKKDVQIPVLRKDFIVDRRQIREAYELGADAILLIAATLVDFELSTFYSIAMEYGMSCLMEVHDEKELERVLKIEPELVGINNRNLKTFTTNIKTSIRLKKMIPEEIISVSESGINHPADCEYLRDEGFDAVLVGESLMREENPGQAIHDVLGL